MAKKEPAAEEAAPLVDVDELLGQLTKKNDEYVFRLRKILTDSGWPEQKQRDMLANLLPEMLEGQRQGKPATQLYGPPTAKADAILKAPKPRPVVPLWLSAGDLTLFFLAIFCVIYGLLATFGGKNMQAGSGILSLAIMSLMAGILFAYFNQWNTLPKDKRPKTWVLLLAGVALILLGSVAASVLSAIKSPVTQASPWPAYLVVAVVAYASHYYLKRRYQLPGLLAAPPANQQKK